MKGLWTVDTHLIYADDFVIFAKATERSRKVVKDALKNHTGHTYLLV